MSHQDIRIGTLAGLDKGAAYLKQIIDHGFESFSLTAWQYLPNIDFDRASKEVLDVIEGKAVISSIGVFGNPLQDERTAADWARAIDLTSKYNCKMVCGFAGALEDRPVNESMEKFKEVWTPLAKQAADLGVRIAWENCDMGGTWERPKWNIAHAPTAWEMMFNAVPSDAIGLEWEPCHQMNSLIDPIPQLRKLMPTGKIFHVHGKDATIAWDVIKTSGLRGGKPWVWHRTPGFGDTNWTHVISILRQHKFRGSIDIEGWHDPVYAGEFEMTGQVYALNYLKQCRGGPFVKNPV